MNECERAGPFPIYRVLINVDRNGLSKIWSCSLSLERESSRVPWKYFYTTPGRFFLVPVTGGGTNGAPGGSEEGGSHCEPAVPVATGTREHLVHRYGTQK